MEVLTSPNLLQDSPDSAAAQPRPQPGWPTVLTISRHTAAEYADVIYKRLGITPSREALQDVPLH